jgi:hypothetical protein
MALFSAGQKQHTGNAAGQSDQSFSGQRTTNQYSNPDGSVENYERIAKE